MNPISRGIQLRTWVLGGCLVLVLLTWVFFHHQINETLTVSLLLRSENPSEELFEDLANNYANPAVFLRRCWGTGKVAHRQLVAAYLKQKSTAKRSWGEDASALIVAGATDADMSVRELCLGALSLNKDP